MHDNNVGLRRGGRRSKNEIYFLKIKFRSGGGGPPEGVKKNSVKKNVKRGREE